ncbi:MAG: rhomboid family intramembrane serine protease [Bdellovibrionaceae bacterium]|nr:rhomboid family intramembrane serine protease [Pseudobdellovibrionaceae bacterium]
MSSWLGLTPAAIWERFYLWQFVTYMFIHSLDVSHLVLNLLMTWLIGSGLEERWGSRKFLLFYLFSGILSGAFYVASMASLSLAGLVNDVVWVPVVGSSGAVFALLTAYGLIYRDQVIHFMFIFPMKAIHFVALLGAMELLQLLSHGVGGSPVAHLAHLGGVVAGWLLLRFWIRRSPRSGLIKKRPHAHLQIVVNNEDQDEPKRIKYWN